MFQLLIFFMLSTSLAPYALLPLPAGQPANGDIGEEGGIRQEDGTRGNVGPAPVQVIWHLQRGHLREGARPIAFDALTGRLTALRGEGIEELVLFITPAAESRDLAEVLEALQRDGPARVQLIGG